MFVAYQYTKGGGSGTRKGNRQQDSYPPSLKRFGFLRILSGILGAFCQPCCFRRAVADRGGSRDAGVWKADDEQEL